jgi:mRNA interferase MazF
VVKRGEVWLIVLDPTIGVTITDSRPCVVVSPSELNDHLSSIIVAPMTTEGMPAPFRILVTFQRKRGLILVDQVRVIEKKRLIRKMGAVSSKTLAETLATLQEIFAE